MQVKLVGITKPILEKEKSFLEINYSAIENILEDVSIKERKNAINGIKRFSQNCARVCYSKYDWNDLLKEKFNSSLIDKRIIPSGHHSIFEHIWINFYIKDIEKIGAMILNNEKQLVTSEKSARYTTMKNLGPVQEELYYKWIEILSPKIDLVYPKIKNKKIRTDKINKLAKENARYMTSVFTPTNMVHTINLRQVNYLIDQFEKELLGDVPKGLENLLSPVMKEFANKINSLKISGLEHKKDKKISLFDKREVKEYFGDVYSTNYTLSFAALAQSQRHRTLNYHISDGAQLGAPLGFYLPEIVKVSGKEKEWIKDLEKIAKNDFPQAQLLKVNERGLIEDFRLKAVERLCGHAQYEIMKNTLSTANKYKQFQKEYGENYNKPNCAPAPKLCDGSCNWGKIKAIKRIV